ncbi:hypothetical protein PAMC26577_03465 [Caballeronia sordidicola]|uniref:Uncharacterized protein n=1 Tax=Caballeronia sordidicola TaxID=196367 RepID=A0A242N4Q2_CABSO|nr:hypothetical protein PAMC26577_03465 [Caballeronia sordidicola]
MKDETLSESVWYQELQDYQIEPMHALLMDRGYKPGTTDTKLSKMLKLIRAGKEDSPVSFGVGTGAKRVSFSDGKTMHYRLREHSVQWRGNSGRIRLNGKLVSIWEYLGDSVSVDERPLVLAAAASAKAEVDKRRKSIQKHEAQIAALDAVFELDAETPEV